MKEIERNLKENFSDVCDWFLDNKLSIHFAGKMYTNWHNYRINKVSSLDIKYGEIHIKHYHSDVTYLGFSLDEPLFGKSMALNVVIKINSTLRFLYRRNRFLSPPLRRLLCISLIQPHFDYDCSACSAWYSNLNKRSNSKLQILQK